MRRLNFTIIAAFIFFILYQIGTALPPTRYLGFVPIDWTNAECQALGPRKLPGLEASVSTWNETSQSIEIECDSRAVKVYSPLIEFEFAGFPGGEIGNKVALQLRTSNPDRTITLPLDALADTDGTQWNSFYYKFPAEDVPAYLSIRLIDQSLGSDSTWIALRNRVSFYQPQTLIYTIHDALKPDFAAFSLALGLALLLLPIMAKLLKHSVPDLAFALFIFSILLFTHFRSSGFFIWDEWHVLERFAKDGIKAVLSVHNEHFLPLFFTWYYLEALILGDKYSIYLILGICLHTFNVLILSHLLENLQGESEYRRISARFIAFLFGISSLHSEVLHGAFGQCVILAETASLLCLKWTLKYAEQGRSSLLLRACLASLVAPLLFGNGLNSFFKAGILLLLVGLFSTKENNKILARTLTALAAHALCCAVSAFIYLQQKTPAGEAIRTLDLDRAINYILVGSELGTVLRGMGLFPWLELSLQASSVPGFLTRFISPELFFTSIGALASLILLLYSLTNTRHKWLAFRLCILGHGFIFMTFILPSITRWKFGIEQALALRYQYSALIGLAIALLPLSHFVWQLYKYSRNKGMQQFYKLVCTLFFVYYLSIHLYLGYNFRFNTENGAKNITYVDKLLDWNKKLISQQGDTALSFEGKGTPVQSLYPLMPQFLTPGRHPDEIYGVLHFLNSKKFVMRQISTN